MLLMLVTSAISQVKWNFRAVQIDKSDFIIHATAIIDPTWHIYSQRADKDVATHLKLSDNPMITHLSKTQEQGNMIDSRGKDDNHRRRYEGYVSFIQPVRIKDTQTPIVVKGRITYQLCDGEGNSRHTAQEFTVILSKEN